eukprot:ctg_343.g145
MASSVSQTLYGKGDGDTILLSKGHPNPKLLPLDALATALETSCTRSQAPTTHKQYGSPYGLTELRKEIARMLREETGSTTAREENIMITNGSGQALDMICALMLRRGDLVVVENPTYFLAFYTFRDYGLHVAEIDTDEHGLQVEILEQRLGSHRGDLAARAYAQTGGAVAPLPLQDRQRRGVWDVVVCRSAAAVADGLRRPTTADGAGDELVQQDPRTGHASRLDRDAPVAYRATGLQRVVAERRRPESVHLGHRGGTVAFRIPTATRKPTASALRRLLPRHVPDVGRVPAAGNRCGHALRPSGGRFLPVAATASWVDTEQLLELAVAEHGASLPLCRRRSPTRFPGSRPAPGGVRDGACGAWSLSVTAAAVRRQNDAPCTEFNSSRLASSANTGAAAGARGALASQLFVAPPPLIPFGPGVLLAGHAQGARPGNALLGR